MLAKPDLLSDEEIVRLIGIAVTWLGLEEVRFPAVSPFCAPPGRHRRAGRGPGTAQPDVVDDERHRSGRIATALKTLARTGCTSPWTPFGRTSSRP